MKLLQKIGIIIATAVLWCACQNSSGENQEKSTAEKTNSTTAAKTSQFKTNPQHSLAEHLEAVRPTMLRTSTPSGFLPLTRPFVSLAGTSDEMPYFESYFTMLGLSREVVEDMVQNFAHLIDQHGHVPSVQHPHFLSRSHQPMFSLMVKWLDELRGNHTAVVQFYPQLEKEYAFWMDGSKNLRETFTAEKRVVRVQMGNFMNRYFDATPEPRPESAAADQQAASANTSRPVAETYQHLRAAAESGWGMSSRWGIDANNIGQLETADLLPIDLNSLMWHLENTLAEAATRAGDAQKAQHYGSRAQNRRQLLRDLFFNSQSGWYEDFNWKTRNLTGRQTLAGMYPLWMDLVEKNQATAVAKTLETKFLRHGGVPATLERTGYQFDLPYTSAPLIWATVQGLKNYQFNALAQDIQQRWTNHCTDIFKKTGKIVQHYNVENPQEQVNGEYPFQDGFGPTNGVLWQWVR